MSFLLEFILHLPAFSKSSVDLPLTVSYQKQPSSYSSHYSESLKNYFTVYLAFPEEPSPYNNQF